jgi:uncharacterized coiled-coil protein SlyX
LIILWKINLQQSGIRASSLDLLKMPPETRSQDVRRCDGSLEAANQRIDGIEIKLNTQSDDLGQLKAMMKEIATQQIAIKHTLQTLTGETSSSQRPHAPQPPTTNCSQGWVGEGS